MERITDSTRRFPAGVLSSSPVATLSRRDRVLIPTCIIFITALAWAYLVHLDRQMAASMDQNTMMAQMGMAMDRAWTAADVLFTFAMWTVMMVGMMAGSAAPILLLFAVMRAKRGERSVRLEVLPFGLGYLAVWVGFSACAALVQWALHQEAMLSSAMAAASPRLGGAILIATGTYQLTPFKGACLTQCRSPLGFLMTNWRAGMIGALQMGLRHGAFCVGCCWALMSVLFVVGVMNLPWVAVLAAFVLVEKIGPAGAVLARVAGAVMVVFGTLIVAGFR